MKEKNLELFLFCAESLLRKIFLSCYVEKLVFEAVRACVCDGKGGSSYSAMILCKSNGRSSRSAIRSTISSVKIQGLSAVSSFNYIRSLKRFASSIIIQYYKLRLVCLDVT